MGPTARRLLDPSLQPDSPEARALLRRWAWVQAVPSAVGLLATAWMAFRLAAHP
jgi:hypothetical protein